MNDGSVHLRIQFICFRAHITHTLTIFSAYSWEAINLCRKINRNSRLCSVKAQIQWMQPKSISEGRIPNKLPAPSIFSRENMVILICSWNVQSKVNGYSFRVSNPAIFSFAFLLNGNRLLKGRICSCRSKFFPLSVDPVLEGSRSPVKQMDHRNCTRFFKSGGNMAVYPCTLRLPSSSISSAQSLSFSSSTWHAKALNILASSLVATSPLPFLSYRWNACFASAITISINLVYQKTDDKIFVCNFSKSVKSKLYHIENYKTRGQTV